MAILKIRRYSRSDGEWIQEFDIPDGDMTVLHAIQIAGEMDDTLAYTQGCRYRYCGLCSVMINDRPRPACLTRFTDSTLVEPLKNLDVIRDLVVDRGFILQFLSGLDFSVNELDLDEFKRLKIPDELFMISRCNDCLCCISTCNNYKGAHEPWRFVKLLNLHLNPFYHPGDIREEREILHRCEDCMKCYCVHGINLGKVIRMLSEIMR